MKINSITTEALNRYRKVESVSMTQFKVGEKPLVKDIYNPFWDVEKEIKEHMSFESRTVQWFMVTIKTTKGKFIQGYAKGCFK
ncbi:MAG TPA: hypothetical protein VF679_09975 [Pedobacter sp.]